MEKTCPKCRTPRGLSKTFVLKGFDDFVKKIEDSTSSPIMSEDDDEENEELDDTLPVTVPSD